MEEIGFEDVIEKSFYWPTSLWARGKYFNDIVMLCQETILRGLEALSLKVMQHRVVSRGNPGFLYRYKK